MVCGIVFSVLPEGSSAIAIEGAKDKAPAQSKNALPVAINFLNP